MPEPSALTGEELAAIQAYDAKEPAAAHALGDSWCMGAIHRRELLAHIAALERLLDHARLDSEDGASLLQEAWAERDRALQARYVLDTKVAALEGQVAEATAQTERFAIRWDTEHTRAEEAERQRTEYRTALVDLCNAIQYVHTSPKYIAVWELAMLHGMPYRGPTYEQPLIDALSTLGCDASPRVADAEGT